MPRTYAIIQRPISLEHRETMTKAELKAYMAWFQQVIPERIAELTRTVRCTRGFVTWDPDATPDSLDTLGRWFEGQVEMRSRTTEEIARARAGTALPIDIPKETLTDRSVSLAIDIGMYFAQVVLKNLSGVQWHQPLGSKRDMDYGHPVISGFGPIFLNPVRVIVVTAQCVGRHDPARLRELYEWWAAKVEK